MAIERTAARLLIFDCAGFRLVSATNEQSRRLLAYERPPAIIIGLSKHVQMSRPMAYAFEMTTAGQFIADLQKERRVGNVSGETEQHLKHEFRKLGWDASEVTLATAIDSEINRLEREAATLRKLRAGFFGEARECR
jgi:hypothetical protein